MTRAEMTKIDRSALLNIAFFLTLLLIFQFGPGCVDNKTRENRRRAEASMTTKLVHTNNMQLLTATNGFRVFLYEHWVTQYTKRDIYIIINDATGAIGTHGR